MMGAEACSRHQVASFVFLVGLLSVIRLDKLQLLQLPFFLVGRRIAM